MQTGALETRRAILVTIATAAAVAGADLAAGQPTQLNHETHRRRSVITGFDRQGLLKGFGSSVVRRLSLFPVARSVGAPQSTWLYRRSSQTPSSHLDDLLTEIDLTVRGADRRFDLIARLKIFFPSALRVQKQLPEPPLW